MDLDWTWTFYKTIYLFPVRWSGQFWMRFGRFSINVYEIRWVSKTQRNWWIRCFFEFDVSKSSNLNLLGFTVPTLWIQSKSLNCHIFSQTKKPPTAASTTRLPSINNYSCIWEYKLFIYTTNLPISNSFSQKENMKLDQ